MELPDPELRPLRERNILHCVWLQQVFPVDIDMSPAPAKPLLLLSTCYLRQKAVVQNEKKSLTAEDLVPRSVQSYLLDQILGHFHPCRRADTSPRLFIGPEAQTATIHAIFFFWQGICGYLSARQRLILQALDDF